MKGKYSRTCEEMPNAQNDIRIEVPNAKALDFVKHPKLLFVTKPNSKKSLKMCPRRFFYL
jgi:hypothetical protein